MCIYLIFVVCCFNECTCLLFSTENKNVTLLIKSSIMYLSVNQINPGCADDDRIFDEINVGRIKRESPVRDWTTCKIKFETELK